VSLPPAQTVSGFRRVEYASIRARIKGTRPELSQNRSYQANNVAAAADVKGKPKNGAVFAEVYLKIRLV
jgi:hypothetical protein